MLCRSTRLARVRTTKKISWDMRSLAWPRIVGSATPSNAELFKRELFRVDEPPRSDARRLFKAGPAGSDVGRRFCFCSASVEAIPPWQSSEAGLEESKAARTRAPLCREALRCAITACIHSISLRRVFARLRGSISCEPSPGRATYVDRECEGDYLRVPSSAFFFSEAARWRPSHLRAARSSPRHRIWSESVYLSKVAQLFDEWDPLAVCRAVYAASRRRAEMIELLKVSASFFSLAAADMTHERTSGCAFSPDLSSTRLFRAHQSRGISPVSGKEKETEALLACMVIIKVPYALSYRDEATYYSKLVQARRRSAHAPDPHCWHLAAVFASLSTRHRNRKKAKDREGLDLPKKVRIFAGEAVEGFSETEIVPAERPSPGGDEGLVRLESSVRDPPI